jgi:hypothetical protein
LPWTASAAALKRYFGCCRLPGWPDWENFCTLGNGLLLEAIFFHGKRCVVVWTQVGQATTRVIFTETRLVTPVVTQGPYSESCSNLRCHKLLQKSSVSKFVCSVAKCFLSTKFHH